MIRRGKAIPAVLVTLLFVASIAFLLYRTGVISWGLSPEDWSIPDPELSDSEPRVRAFVTDARQRVVQDPASVDAWSDYAMALDAHLFGTMASEAYSRAHLLDPDEFLWVYHQAVSLFFQSAPPEEVIELLEKSITLRPDYAPAHVRLGDVYLGMGRSEEAKLAYAKALELDPEMAVAHRSLGQLLLTERKFEEAVRRLEQADLLVPDDRSVAAALAQGYMSLGDTDKASKYSGTTSELEVRIGLEDPVRIEVDDHGVSVRLCDDRATRRMQEGLHAEALKDLQIVLESFPNDPFVHLKMGKCYYEMNRPDLAVNHLVGAVQLNDDLAEAHGLLGKIYWKRDWTLAAFHYQRQIESSEPDAKMYTNLAISSAEAGNIELALDSFRKAAEIAPEIADKHSDLANALMIMDDLDGAKDAALKAIELNPLHSKANFILGQIHERREEFDEAIDFYRKASRADPASPATERLMDLTARRREGG
jgi:tetratricopeptide (TPR) repeat protein